MTRKNAWRKPSWLFVSITLAGVFFLSYLGVWQLQRAEEKKQILVENEQQLNGAPESLTLPIEDPAVLRFKKIKMQGHYLSAHQFVLDNQVLQHNVGYNILTPFVLNGSKKVVLVDRGWVPQGSSRENLPNIEIDDGLQTIIGAVYVPFGDPFTLGEVDNGETTWPRLIQYLDFAALETRLGQPLLPLTVRLVPGQESGFETEWPLFVFSPKRHLAYAVQWFALALTLLIIFIVLHMPKKTNKKN